MYVFRPLIVFACSLLVLSIYKSQESLSMWQIFISDCSRIVQKAVFVFLISKRKVNFATEFYTAECAPARAGGFALSMVGQAVTRLLTPELVSALRVGPY